MTAPVVDAQELIRDAKADYARSEAAGDGDYELALVPDGSSPSSFVDSYEAHIPELPDSFSAAVRKLARGVTAHEVDQILADVRRPGPRESTDPDGRTLKDRLAALLAERQR